jgi:hypothetical protein
MIDGFPSPYVVSDRSPKQFTNVNLSPYTITMLQGFGSFGMTQSQVVEWLAKNYYNSLRQTEPPKINVKQPKTKQKQSAYPQKKPFVHVPENSLKVKKTKIKPVRE